MTAPPAPPRPGVSVVIGAQYAAANLPAILDALCGGLDAGWAEVLVCHAADDPVTLAPRPGLRTLPGAPGALIPELWRDGILAARAETVALLSAHCIPDAAWLGRVATLDMQARVAYGGLIVNDPASDAAGAAVHLLPYHGFASAAAPRAVREIAADNAVYRRDAILACADLLDEGFWEPGYHARFRAAGLTLELRPDLVATHVNRYSPRQFMRQRRLHGRNFGMARARPASASRRWLMVLTSPAAFPVFALKLTRMIRRDPVLRRDFGRAAGWFYLFMAHWSLGEMEGYALTAWRGRR